MSGLAPPVGSQASDPAQWVERHGDALFRYAKLRVRDTQVAEDLVQDAFLAALAARERFNESASERTWLIAILRHKIIDHLRRAGRQQPSDCDPDADVAHRFFDQRALWVKGPAKWSFQPDQLLEQSEFWEVLHRCLSKLSPRLADAFCLREIDQCSTEEICKVLGISANNLWTQLHRARLLLRQCLEDNWFARSGTGAKK